MTLNNNNNIYIGIDPGLADTGWGVVKAEGSQVIPIDYGSIKTDKNKKITSRLLTIEKELQTIINKYQPTAAGIEKLFFNTNITTALTVGECRGVALLTLAKNNLPTIELTPLQVKHGITGYGQADKKQIQEMVKLILKLKETPKPDDASDALAIAIVASSHRLNS